MSTESVKYQRRYVALSVLECLCARVPGRRASRCSALALGSKLRAFGAGAVAPNCAPSALGLWLSYCAPSALAPWLQIARHRCWYSRSAKCPLRSLWGAVTRMLRYISRNTLASSNSFSACHVFCREAPIRFARSCCVILILTG